MGSTCKIITSCITLSFKISKKYIFSLECTNHTEKYMHVFMYISGPNILKKLLLRH